jgi:hypothetical protein
LDHAIEVVGNWSREILRQLREVASSKEVVARSAVVLRLLFEPAKVHSNGPDAVHAVAGAELASREPLNPGRRVGAIEGVERQRLRIEPDVKVPEDGLIASDGGGLVSRLKSLREPRRNRRKLDASRPQGLRIETEEVTLMKPPEVPKEIPPNSLRLAWLPRRED